MKNLRIAALAPFLLTASAVTALASGLGLPTPAPTAESRAQETDLAQRIGALEKRLAAVEATNAELKSRTDETTAYLVKQAEAGESLIASLAESETLGFTKGINFESRVVLLAGLRAFCAAQQTGVPKPAPKPDAKNGRDGARR